MALQALHDAQETLQAQARTRKTVDVAPLRTYAVSTINNAQRYLSHSFPGNADALAQAQRDGEHWLHVLGAYGGFNDRTWLALCDTPHWHQITQRVNAAGPRHWRNLQRILSRFQPTAPRHYFSAYGETFRPTAEELARVLRIHEHYCTLFGLND